ncbi:glyoxalase [Streptococcus oricebi]|uniref:Glyoxalase n=1 Tax=Streptococcus oricebi TaxID=1547447 RepID=A0ABS5B4F6_9STRE|nr:glyoxalase [Streptococcus oricebi]MBP2623396.1 glyoxalase [Streptococcus oricebi]
MLNSFYPVLMCQEVDSCADFFTRYFHFDCVFQSDWYVSLKSKEGFELAVIASHHDTIPETYRQICQGIILNLEVENVSDLYSIFKEEKEVQIIQELRDEGFGQRHFIIAGPENILIDIIKVIPPSKQYAENYQ